ncbi:MAG TPA: branched-chain amino acid ABC transporter permease [Chloroflexi bacterium]|nr:branched-chain amino acid ABC transporter permease [Chloroflexota bacterium]
MKTLKNHLGLITSLVIVILIAIAPIVSGNAASREVVFTILRAIVLASSLNILLGYTGYVSFGHIVFFGFGGYVGFYLITAQGQSLWVAMLAGGVVSGLLAYLLGKAILRLRGAYFALATIGVNEAVRAFINNFEPFGGPTGMTMNFSVYQEYGGAMKALEMSFYIMLVLALLVVVLSYVVRTSKFGLGLLAIREDEDAAEVMGVVAPDAKTWAFVLSAIFPGMVGALFFFKNGSVEPLDAFPLHTSIEMIVMVMLGGQGTVLGPILGAAGYQRMRGLLVTSPIFKNIQLAVSGGLLLLIVLFVPAGVIGWARQRWPKLRRVLQ